MKLNRNLKFETPYGPGIAVEGEVYFGRKCVVEAPACLLSGYYGVGEIGAFSYFNGNFTAADLKSIGRFSSIAPDVVISDFQHPSSLLTIHNAAFNWPDSNYWYKNFSPLDQSSPEIQSRQRLSGLFTWKGDTIVGNDVWIGRRAQIKNGVRIGDGAIIGAGSIVTKDVPPYTIVAGVPARIIRARFSPEIIERLLHVRWWDFGPAILNGCDFSDIERAVAHLEDQSAKLEKAEYPKFIIDPQNETVLPTQTVQTPATAPCPEHVQSESKIANFLRRKFRKSAARDNRE